MISSDLDQDWLQQDLHHLADLAHLTDWEKSWDMEFHPTKCRNALRHSYELHGHILDTVQPGTSGSPSAGSSAGTSISITSATEPTRRWDP